MRDYWPDTLHQALGDGPAVMVTVIRVKGSAPRAVGARMLITPSAQSGSIGGGRLEYEATREARRMLENGQDRDQARGDYGLGPVMNQCCGGAVTLLYERFHDARADWLRALRSPEGRAGELQLISAVDQADKWCLAAGADADLPTGLAACLADMPVGPGAPPRLTETGGTAYFVESPCEQAIPLVLFGAGHVATAFVRLAEAMPFRVYWIDSRADQFPSGADRYTEVIVTDDPVAELGRFGPGHAYLVMTHSHELDEDICAAVLEQGDFSWLGLIGSVSKRRRFVHRLARRGCSEEALARLVCPVGIAGISGKRPATIALSITAQLLQDCVPETWR